MRWIARQAARALVPVAEAADALGGVVSGAIRRQGSGLQRIAHRPLPLPEAPWVLGQSWLDLLFAHWRVAAEQLRSHLPAALELDLFDGDAWLSVTPFEVRGARARGVPPPPVLSRFPELNVRTYVTHAQRPGIWFFSLDAGSGLAGAAARTAYRLPYFRARMDIDAEQDPWIDYRGERVDRRRAPATLRARYRPLGGHRHAEPGSLEAWLVERYRLYTVHRGEVFATDIHHRPWTLQDAHADLRSIRWPTPRPPARWRPAAPVRRAPGRRVLTARAGRRGLTCPTRSSSAPANGLVAANHLADRGWEVLVLKAAAEPGGAVRSAPLTGDPGFVHDVFSAFYPFAPASAAIRALDLEAHGLRWCHGDLVVGPTRRRTARARCCRGIWRRPPHRSTRSRPATATRGGGCTGSGSGSARTSPRRS